MNFKIFENEIISFRFRFCFFNRKNSVFGFGFGLSNREKSVFSYGFVFGLKNRKPNRKPGTLSIHSIVVVILLKYFLKVLTLVETTIIIKKLLKINYPNIAIKYLFF